MVSVDIGYEAIANNSSTQTSLQEKYFKDQAEKHELLKKSSELQVRLRNEMLNKAALDVLILKNSITF